MVVYREVDDKELQAFLNHRGNNRRREDTFRKEQFDEAGRDDRECSEEKDRGDKVQGFGFVTVLFVDIEQDEQGGGDGKEEEIQHYLSIGG
jgi:hypothetical protein